MMTLRLNIDKYFNMGRWVQPALPGIEWIYWYEANSAKVISQGGRLHPILFLDGNTLIAKDDTHSCRKLVNTLSKEKGFASYVTLLDDTGNKCTGEHLAMLGMMDLATDQYVRKLFVTYREIIGFWVMMHLLGEAVNDLIKTLGLASSDEEVLARVGSIARPTWLEEQARGVAQLARRIVEEKPKTKAGDITESFIDDLPWLGKAIDKFINEYNWFSTHHWQGDGYARADCREEINNAISQGGYSKSNESLNKVDKNSAWNLLVAVSYWRTHCAEVTNKVIYGSRLRLVELAARWGMTYEQLLNLTATEVIAGLSVDPDDFARPDNYQERLEAYGGYLDEQGHEVIVTGDALQSLMDQMIVAVDDNVVEIKGVSASGGKVTGSVKILISPKDFNDFKEGNVLVAPETTPDFVPCMKKSKAIVTEYGGITSHAAIVARELGKPCVINTKTATQVLKDGDMVEVDADRGIVRKIDN